MSFWLKSVTGKQAPKASEYNDLTLITIIWLT